MIQYDIVSDSLLKLSIILFGIGFLFLLDKYLNSEKKMRRSK